MMVLGRVLRAQGECGGPSKSVIVLGEKEEAKKVQLPWGESELTMGKYEGTSSSLWEAEGKTG